MRTRVVLWSIIAVGAVLRLRVLPIGLWRDEALTYLDVRGGSLLEMASRMKSGDQHPPLFFIVERTWCAIAGYGPIAMKIPPFVLGVATIPLVYLLARRVAGSATALGAAALFALLPSGIWYAQEVRPYTAAAFLATLCAMLYLRTFEDRSPRALALFAAGTAALASTHYTGLIFIAAIVAIELASRSRERIIVALVAVLSTAAAYLPWLPVLLKQLGEEFPWSNVALAQRPLIPLDHAYAALPFLPIAPVSVFERNTNLVEDQPSFLLLAALALALMALFVFRARRSAKSGDERDRATFRLGAIVMIGWAVAALAGAAALRYGFTFSPLAIVVFAKQLFEPTRASDGDGRRPPARLMVRATALLVFATSALTAQFTVTTASALPKSGLPALVAAAPHGPGTIWLVVPDDYGSTVAYHTRESIQGFGFVQWEHPELLRIDGYAERWRDDDAIPRTLANLDRLVRRGATRLVIVRSGDYELPLVDSGHVRYSLANLFLDRVAERYEIVSCAKFPGSVEPASLLIVDPSSTASRAERLAAKARCLPVEHSAAAP